CDQATAMAGPGGSAAFPGAYPGRSGGYGKLFRVAPFARLAARVSYADCDPEAVAAPARCAELAARRSRLGRASSVPSPTCPAWRGYPGPLDAGLSGTGLVADDLYLMAHGDRTGRPRLQPRPLGIGLAGALLTELMLAGWIGLRRDSAVVIIPGVAQDIVMRH